MSYIINKFSKYTREFNYNLKLAYPVMIGMLGHTFVQFVDNVMVGQLGTAELAAISLGNSFVFIAMSIGIGFSTAITPLIAEADGAKNKPRVIEIFEHSFLICFILAIILTTIVFLNRNLVSFMGQPIEVVELAIPYLFWVSISLIAVVNFQSFRQFADGMSITKAAMYSVLAANLINVILNYLLIFGIWKFPELGLEGAAIGTLISRFSMLIFIIFYLKLHKKLSFYIKNFYPKKIIQSKNITITQIGLRDQKGISALLYATGASGLEGLLAGLPTLRLRPADRVAINVLPEGVEPIVFSKENLAQTLSEVEKQDALDWKTIYSHVDIKMWRKLLAIS